MNYAEEKTRIENEIKELTAKLENLKKQESKEAWKNSLVEKFKEFLERTDFAKVDIMEFNAKKSESSIPVACEAWFYNEKPKEGLVSIREFEGKPIKAENPEKVETEPTAEPKTEETNEPENKFKIGDYVYYRNCNVYGDIVEIKGGIISIKEKDGNIYKVHPEWIYKTEKPAEKPENKVVVCSVPKPNETTEEKPVKMKMTLDEFIDSLPEPAGK